MIAARSNIVWATPRNKSPFTARTVKGLARSRRAALHSPDRVLAHTSPLHTRKDERRMSAAPPR